MFASVAFDVLTTGSEKARMSETEGKTEREWGAKDESGKEKAREKVIVDGAV